MYVYFYSLHVSGSHEPIIRRIIVSMRHLVYVTLGFPAHRVRICHLWVAPAILEVYR